MTTKAIKSFDLFGHRVGFNFDKKGEKHNTCGGGCLSILFYLFVIGLVLT